MSIQSQTYSDYEVWVVDGKSVDGSKNFLKQLNPPFYCLSEQDVGVYDAMNKGVKRANGQWLYFLGSDDELYSNNVLNNIFGGELDNSVDIIIGSVKYNYDKSDSNFLKRNHGIFKSKWSRLLWFKNTLHHQSIFYNKNIFDDESYCLNYKILSDYFLNLKLFKDKSEELIIRDIIASCGTKGISKNYNWNLYIEEVNLKVALTSLYLKPLFFLIVLIKFLVKKFY